jgi:hypothetical protein
MTTVLEIARALCEKLRINQAMETSPFLLPAR